MSDAPAPPPATPAITIETVGLALGAAVTLAFGAFLFSRASTRPETSDELAQRIVKATLARRPGGPLPPSRAPRASYF